MYKINYTDRWLLGTYRTNYISSNMKKKNVNSAENLPNYNLKGKTK